MCWVTLNLGVCRWGEPQFWGQQTPLNWGNLGSGPQFVGINVGWAMGGWDSSFKSITR